MRGRLSFERGGLNLHRDEATAVLHGWIQTLQERSYQELLQYLNNASCSEVQGPSGQVYQIEVEALWDNKLGSDLRVLVSIDDGSLRWATFPLTQDFMVRSDGSFVGE
jgi:hypothetical protein